MTESKTTQKGKQDLSDIQIDRQTIEQWAKECERGAFDRKRLQTEPITANLTGDDMSITALKEFVQSTHPPLLFSSVRYLRLEFLRYRMQHHPSPILERLFPNVEELLVKTDEALRHVVVCVRHCLCLRRILVSSEVIDHSTRFVKDVLLWNMPADPSSPRHLDFGLGEADGYISKTAARRILSDVQCLDNYEHKLVLTSMSVPLLTLRHHHVRGTDDETIDLPSNRALWTQWLHPWLRYPHLQILHIYVPRGMNAESNVFRHMVQHVIDQVRNATKKTTTLQYVYLHTRTNDRPMILWNYRVPNVQDVCKRIQAFPNTTVCSCVSCAPGWRWPMELQLLLTVVLPAAVRANVRHPFVDSFAQPHIMQCIAQMVGCAATVEALLTCPHHDGASHRHSRKECLLENPWLHDRSLVWWKALPQLPRVASRWLGSRFIRDVRK